MGIDMGYFFDILLILAIAQRQAKPRHTNVYRAYFIALVGDSERSKMKKKATEDQFNELHNLVTKEFLSRIKSGEATTQDLKAACDWLKANDISGVAYNGNPLEKLAKVMPTVDPELVQAKLYGKNL